MQVTGGSGARINNGFVPASGPDTALDPIVDALMAGISLGADAEREAIATGWQ